MSVEIMNVVPVLSMIGLFYACMAEKAPSRLRCWIAWFLVSAIASLHSVSEAQQTVNSVETADNQQLLVELSDQAD